jgi:hypothetical protein
MGSGVEVRKCVWGVCGECVGFVCGECGVCVGVWCVYGECSCQSQRNNRIEEQTLHARKVNLYTTQSTKQILTLNKQILDYIQFAKQNKTKQNKTKQNKISLCTVEWTMSPTHASHAARYKPP